ncbi:Scr1 family TA system antitoxin-like transcriptional regulator [Streptomyces sp. CB02613]|uniref:Scr1 family TA system antitoxin-like transcriptional regulator n=1 Tax=Streptomyces sp. CB02613 TaxID=2020328 RepID=UPI001F1985AE|nr:Scr1 family TA system antitoxin-like transcriptional regulator [Streptomyces sp. CB02613]
MVGAQLRHFRKLAGLTQAALAEQAGVGEDTIASIEQGRRALQLDLAVQLDELLDTKGALRVAVEESILHAELGDHEVMLKQLLHLRRCMDLPFVTIQIMPRSTPRHAGLSGPLILLETPDHDGLAYVDGQLRGELYDEPSDVSALMQRYGSSPPPGAPSSTAAAPPSEQSDGEPPRPPPQPGRFTVHPLTQPQ